MQARIVRVGVGLALLLGGYVIGSHAPSSVHAEMRVSVPAGYGRLAAGDSASLWFEDSAGTLRQVTIPAGNTVFTITRPK